MGVVKNCEIWFLGLDKETFCRKIDVIFNSDELTQFVENKISPYVKLFSSTTKTNPFIFL